jgi:hypothetical protein
VSAEQTMSLMKPSFRSPAAKWLGLSLAARSDLSRRIRMDSSLDSE